MPCRVLHRWSFLWLFTALLSGALLACASAAGTADAPQPETQLAPEPHIALLSFSNFGSVKHPHALKVKRAVEMVKERAPQLVVDGEMQSDTAVTPELLAANYPFSTLKGAANVLIFPDLTSGNICYKLLNRLGGAEAIGPILMGMEKPIHVLQRGDDVANIVNMAAIAVVDAQNAQRRE